MDHADGFSEIAEIAEIRIFGDFGASGMTDDRIMTQYEFF